MVAENSTRGLAIVRGSARGARFKVLSLAVVSAAAAILPGHARADVLAAWDFNGKNSMSSNGSLPASTVGTNVAVGNLNLPPAPPLVYNTTANSFGGAGWGEKTTEAAAIAGGFFYNFTVTPSTGFAESFSSISPYNIRRSSTGPATGIFQYQVGSGSFLDIGTPITFGAVTTSSGNPQGMIDLSGIGALQNAASAVTFRIVMWNDTNAGGTVYLNGFQSGNDLIFNGTTSVAQVSSPPYFWIGNDTTLGGDGTWDNSTTMSWSSDSSNITPVVWDSTKLANFGGVGGNVTIDPAGVNANANMQFDADGYVLSGGALNLGGTTPTVTVTNDTSTARISSSIISNAGLTKSGLGTLILDGNSTYTGDTTLAAGALQLGNGGTTGSIAGNVANTGVVIFNRTDDITFAGDITGGGSIVKLTSNALTVTGNVSGTGGVTVAGGTLQVGNGGTTGSLAGSVLNGGAVVFNRSDDLAYPGSVSGSGSVTKLGAGVLTVTGALSHTGGTTVSAGTLQIGNGGTVGSVTGDIANSGIVTFNRSDNIIYGGAVSGAGSLIQNGPGKLTLTGNSSYTGGTSVSNGSTLQLGNSGISGSVAGDISNSGSLIFKRSDSVTFAGAISGAGNVTKAGSGTLVFGANNTHQGGTTLAGGTLVAASNGSFSNGAVTATTGNLFARAGVNVGNAITVSGTPAPAITASQNFDTLPTAATATASTAWQNDSTLPGWFLYRQPVPGTAITAIAIDSGTLGNGSFYSFGQPSSTERALGGVGSGGAYFGTPASAAVAGWMATRLTNTTGTDINSFTFHYDGEEWRSGGNTAKQTMTVQYGFGTNFTDVLWINAGAAFSFASPVATVDPLALDGNADTNRTPDIGGTISNTWSAGSNLWIRWVETNDSGLDHALAIDNFAFGAGAAAGGASTVALGTDSTSGTATYSGAITLNSGVTLTAPAGGAVVFTGAMTENGPQSVSKTGAGTAHLTVANTYSGGTNVSDGTLSVGNLGALGSGGVAISGGKLMLDSSLGSTFTLPTLAISGSGQFDLTNNDVVIPTGDSLVAATIRGYLAAGFDSGAWDGAGIVSSTAAGDANSITAVGMTYDGSQVHLKYTYYGDTDLNGAVNTADFQNFLDGFATGGSTWSQGDFTYDDKVDLGNDFNLFLVAYLKQGGSLGDLAAIINADDNLTIAQKSLFLAAVPEPTSLAALAAVGALGLRRRRAK